MKEFKKAAQKTNEQPIVADLPHGSEPHVKIESRESIPPAGSLTDDSDNGNLDSVPQRRDQTQNCRQSNAADRGQRSIYCDLPVSVTRVCLSVRLSARWCHRSLVVLVKCMLTEMTTPWLSCRLSPNRPGPSRPSRRHPGTC